MAFEPLTALLDVGGKLIDRLWENPADREAAKLKLAEMQQNGELAVLAAQTDLAKAQIDVNKTEAQNANVFVSGWRPFIGWVCGGALAYHFILQPLLAFLCASAGHPVTLPIFQMDTLNTVLMAMLGFGGLRTVEKVKGVA